MTSPYTPLTPKQSALAEAVHSHAVGTNPIWLRRQWEAIDQAQHCEHIGRVGPVSSPDLFLDDGCWNTPPPPRAWSEMDRIILLHQELFEALERAKERMRGRGMVSTGTQTARSEVAFRVPTLARRSSDPPTRSKSQQAK